MSGTTLRASIVFGAFAIALILGIPAWQNQIRERNAALSAANLRQWGIALALYMGESENCLPVPGLGDDTYQAENAWYNALPPYLGLPMLKNVPSAQRPAPGKGSIWVDPAVPAKVRVAAGQTFFSYGMNARLVPPEGNALKIYEVDPPSAVVFLTEVSGFDPTARPESVVFRHGPGAPLAPTAYAHVLFCDGHVERVSPARWVLPVSENGSIHWNYQISSNH